MYAIRADLNPYHLFAKHSQCYVSETFICIISIMIGSIIIVMNVKTLIINISTLRFIHTCSINALQYSVVMIRYNGRAVVTTM